MQRLIPITIVAVLFLGCRTVPPTMIGAETRDKINTLETQAEQTSVQTVVIDYNVDTINTDMNTLESKIPDELKPEYHALQSQVAALSVLTETHKSATSETIKNVVDVQTSFEGDIEKTAVAVQEKNDAKLREQKANNRSLILFGIIGILVLCTGGYLTLKYYFHLPI